MNQLVGQKIAITSPVSQTTRNRLRGILTTDTGQIVFVDTPGIHKPHHELGRVLVANSQRTLELVDVLLFIVDGSSPIGGGDRYVAQMLATQKTPVILGINKSDAQPPKSTQLDEGYFAIAKARQWSCFKFSALTGDGLATLLAKLMGQLTVGPYYYPPELITDQPERLIMAELIREQIILLTRQEIPHSVAIQIEKIETTPKMTRIHAVINVERSSQKGIIIGQKGTMLKKIGTQARAQISKLIGGNVFLQLFVRVQNKWRESQAQLAEFGYSLDR